MSDDMRSTDHDFADWLALFRPQHFTLWEFGQYELEVQRGPKF